MKKIFLKNLLTFVSPYINICVTKTKEVTISPRTGRPTTDPKRNDTRIRMSDNEIEMLNYCCEVFGLTKAEVIRLGVKELYEKAQNAKK